MNFTSAWTIVAHCFSHRTPLRDVMCWSTPPLIVKCGVVAVLHGSLAIRVANGMVPTKVDLELDPFLTNGFGSDSEPVLLVKTRLRKEKSGSSSGTRSI